MISLLEATEDENLFRPWFRRRESWSAWFVFLKALFGEPMSDEEMVLYRECTGRDVAPDAVAKECWLVVGRRGGKSFMLALIATYLASFFEYRQFLQPGERGTVLIISATQKQSRTILRYIRGLLTEIPMLKAMIERETQDSFDLVNGITIEVLTASYKSIRGYTVVAALADEIAFWNVDENAAEQDVEILNAIRPAMAMIPNAMLLCASSPYARKGALFEAYRRHFGKSGDPVLAWKASTRTMNPSVPEAVILAAADRDPSHARAEYGAEFREDIETFIRLDVVEACVDVGVTVRPHRPGVSYKCFVDPSGGVSDSFTAAIVHREGKLIVVDRLLEAKPPFSPAAVVSEFARVIRSFRITKVTGDRFAGEWPREGFRNHSLTYEPSMKNKNDIYVAFLPALTSKMILLPDDRRLINQIASLERKTARGGRDSIDHPPGQHDDLANAVAGAASQYMSASRYLSDLSWVDGDADLKRSEQLAYNAYVASGGYSR